jgi:hypothetical protein
MIHSLDADSALRSNEHAHRASHHPFADTAAASGHSHAMTSTYARPAYTYSAEPDFGSLWDPNVLDRLHAPLTRYHE